MSRMNDRQEEIAGTTEGMVVVDAGPGTGKTSTIVERYINIISKPDVNPKEVLLMTFTNNAATEMEERIKGRMTELGMVDESKLVLTKTFDAFCLSIVMDSPELVSDFFGTTSTLTRSARLSENETLNRDYFNRFLDEFLETHGDEYGQYSAIACSDPRSLYNLINKLMSRGTVPVARGWFGTDVQKDLLGNTGWLMEQMERKNVLGSNGGASRIAKIVSDLNTNEIHDAPDIVDGVLMPESLVSAAMEDRTELFRFIHDVYYRYIVSSISDNRLTFGLVAVFAFSILYGNRSVRERNSYRYMMIDEFQDTNSNQLMIALMTLKEPNLCVVGDWKQGIYGFRFVSIDNIVDFERRTVSLRRFLNEGEERVPFRVPDVTSIPLEVNYRSSKTVIDKAFDCLYLKGSDKDDVGEAEIRSRVVGLEQGRDDISDETDVRYVMVDGGPESEAKEVVRAIKDYVGSGRYVVKEGDVSRPLGYGDIAVFCFKTKGCRLILEACQDAGVPAYMQGDMNIMSSREGKLALAWLRFVNNEQDPWGYVPILTDMNYTMAEIRSFGQGKDLRLPEGLVAQRRKLRNKRRRITELLTMLFSYYRLDNDLTQAIISNVSSAHRNSLMTISDVIRMIEEDIEEGTDYRMDVPLDKDAVTIMTMHKSKGLEYPAVIVPFVDDRVMPYLRPDNDTFLFDERLGIRCTKEVCRFGDYSKVCINWRTRLAKGALDPDYSELRRLMFVTMSRAKQYETVISGRNPSVFMRELSGERYSTIPDTDFDPMAHRPALAERPCLSGYEKRRRKLSVHDIMDFSSDDGTYGMGEGCDEVCGKGKEYGTRIHEMAQMMCRGMVVNEDEYPELPRIRRILDSASDADLRLSEVECGLPVDECDTNLRGQIDLLVVYPDRIEVHDYKTDVTDRFETEYKVQLSVYAHAAEGFYGKPVRCFIDYVSRDIPAVEFEPLPMSLIEERVQRAILPIR